MKRGIIAALGACLLLTSVVDAKPVQRRTKISIVPPPPAITILPTVVPTVHQDIPVDTAPRSFRERCALIALQTVMKKNPDIIKPDQREQVVAAAWDLADKMEAERCYRDAINQ